MEETVVERVEVERGDERVVGEGWWWCTYLSPSGISPLKNL